MGEILEFKTRTPKKNLTKRELVAYYVNTSQMEVSYLAGRPLLTQVRIDITGELRHLPNIKNRVRHLPKGAVCFDKICAAKLAAMDFLFSRFNRPADFTFGANAVVCTAIFAASARKFDRISRMETVQDWLEPSTKTAGKSGKTARGWGIGLVEDDYYIIPRALHAWEAGTPPDVTTIILEPWELCREEILTDLARSVCGRGQ